MASFSSYSPIPLLPYSLIPLFFAILRFMDTLSTAFREYIKQVMALSKSPAVVTEANVYQEMDEAILPYLDKMVEDKILPGSGLDGI